MLLNLPLLATIIISYGSTTLAAHKVMGMKNAWPVLVMALIFVIFMMIYGIVGLRLRLNKISEDPSKNNEIRN